jgi:hypothetical protein
VIESKNMRGYRREVAGEMAKPFQRKALDNFASAYREGRAKAFEGEDAGELIREAAGSGAMP